MIPPNASLVKYDNPVLVSRNTDKKTPRARALKVSPQPPQGTGPVPSPAGKQKLAPVDAKSAQQTDEILNSILPPREWTEGGQLWVQQVSSTPATRLDVVNLQEELDRRLQQRQARETGICPVRRELYSQCFDELIRQVTINCAERGLLLLRVRDEIRMTIAAYQTLYESSVAFGMRKALQAEQGKTDMEKKITELEQEKKDLEKQVNEWKMKCEQTEKRATEQRQVEEKKHGEETQFLKRTTQQLKAKEIEEEKIELEIKVIEFKIKCEQAEKRATEQRLMDEKKNLEETQFLRRSQQQIKILELEEEKRDLERQVNEWKMKCEQTEKRATEQRQVEEKKHSEETQFLKRTTQQLKTQLEQLISPKKG